MFKFVEVYDILLEPAIVASKKDELRTRQTSRKVAKASFIFFFLECVSENVEKRCVETNVTYLVWRQRQRVCVCESWWRHGVGEWSIYSEKKKK